MKQAAARKVDDAVLRAVVESDGGDYDAVRRTTIGFAAATRSPAVEKTRATAHATGPRESFAEIGTHCMASPRRTGRGVELQAFRCTLPTVDAASNIDGDFRSSAR